MSPLMSPPPDTPSSVELYKNASVEQRQLSTIDTMKQFSDVTGLAYALDSDFPSARMKAAEYLIDLRSQDGLKDALRNRNRDVRQLVLPQVYGICGPAVLVGAFESGYEDVRLGAVRQIGAREGFAGLAQALKCAKPDVPQEAVRVIANLHRTDVVSLLVQADEYNPAVRGEVIEQLHRLLGTPQYAPAAVRALGKWKDTDGLRLALAAPDPNVGVSAVGYLATIRDQAGIRIAARSTIPEVRQAAIDAMRDSGDNAGLEQLLSAPTTTPQQQLILVDRLEQVRDVGGLCAALSSKDPDVRSKAANDLAKLGDRNAIPYLKTALANEGRASVREALRDALRHLEPDPPSHRLLEALQFVVELLTTIIGIVEIFTFVASHQPKFLSGLLGPAFIILPAIALIGLVVWTQRLPTASSQGSTQSRSSGGRWHAFRTIHRPLIDSVLIVAALLIGGTTIVVSIIPARSTELRILLPIVLLVVVAILVGVSAPGSGFIRNALQAMRNNRARLAGILAILVSVSIVFVALTAWLLSYHAPIPPLPAAHLTEFNVATRGAQPLTIVSGPDGNLWFTEFTGDNIGRITPKGVMQPEDQIQIPQAEPAGIAPASDGTLWFTEANASRIGHVPDPRGNPSYLVGTPIPGGSSPEGITAGPDGAMWFTEAASNNIGRIAPDGQTITEYPIPTSASHPASIVSGPDGALWFTESSAGQIGRITTAGQITAEYPIRTPNSVPIGITAGPDGALWFTESAANKIGRITTSGKITEYSIPTTNAQPWQIISKPGDGLWFTEAIANRIGHITTDGKTTNITDYVIPTAKSSPNGITVGPDGAIWFTEAAADKIGRIILS